ncbi:MAG: hypothetical protein ACTSQJ_00080 [Promethearchaeota archaeon]
MSLTEFKSEPKRVRGFAGLIEKIMEPLNQHEKFKEKFRNKTRKFLINAPNVNFAALIIIDNGTIRVESIANKPKENLKKKVVGWDGFVQMDTQIFLGLALNRLSILKVGMMWIIRKIKIKGLMKLLGFMKILNFLKE